MYSWFPYTGGICCPPRPSVSQSTLSNWMEQLGRQYPRFRDLPLYRVAMPGSHDAGMGNQLPQPGPDFWPNLYMWAEYQVAQAGMPIVEPWSISQDNPVEQQFRDGSRYFDLRVAPLVSNSVTGKYEVCDTKLYTLHGLYGQSVEGILYQLQQALMQNPKEMVILDFQHLWEMTDRSYKTLNELVFKYLGDWLIPTSVSLENPIGMLQDRSQRVLLLMGADHQRSTNKRNPFDYIDANYFWPRSGNLTSNWFNTTDINTLSRSLDEEVRKDQDLNSLWVLQAVLTADVDAIVKGLVKPKQNSLKELEAGVQPVLMDLIQKWTNQGLALNIVMYDYVNSATSHSIINNNLPRIR